MRFSHACDLDDVAFGIRLVHFLFEDNSRAVQWQAFRSHGQGGEHMAISGDQAIVYYKPGPDVTVSGIFDPPD
jgi:hypothetical protein